MQKDIAHVAMHGAVAPHEMLPGTDGDSDNQKVPPSVSSTFIKFMVVQLIYEKTLFISSRIVSCQGKKNLLLFVEYCAIFISGVL